MRMLTSGWGQEHILWKMNDNGTGLEKERSIGKGDVPSKSNMNDNDAGTNTMCAALNSYRIVIGFKSGSLEAFVFEPPLQQ